MKTLLSNLRAFYVTITFILLTLISPAFAVDPLPPTILTGTYGKTVATANGAPIRAAKVTVTKTYYNTNDPAFYQACKDAGLNAVRVVCFDAYWRRHTNVPDNPGVTYDLANQNDLYGPGGLITRLDEVVNLCSLYGLYAIIGSHDIGFRFDEAYANQFWDAVALRYKDRSHVIFELVNEIDWHETTPDNAAAPERVPYGLPGSGQSPWSMVDKLLRVYKRVRTKAPQNHVMLFSLAMTNRGFDGPSSMLGLAIDISNKATAQGVPISWTKESICFHNYAYQSYLPSESAVRDLMYGYPVFCGEVGFPNGVSGLVGTFGSGLGFAPSEQYATASMERLGIGWAQWDIDWYNPGTATNMFKSNYKFVLNDLLYKGRFWSITWLPPYYYVVTSESSGKALTVQGNSNANNALIVQQPLDFNNNYQKIRMINVPSTQFTQMQVMGSGKSLDVRGASQADNALIQQYDYGPLDNKQFAVHRIPNMAYYKIIPRNTYSTTSPRGFDVVGQSLANGAGIQQYLFFGTGTANQHWLPICTDIP